MKAAFIAKVEGAPKIFVQDDRDVQAVRNAFRMRSLMMTGENAHNACKLDQYVATVGNDASWISSTIGCCALRMAKS